MSQKLADEPSPWHLARDVLDRVECSRLSRLVKHRQYDASRELHDQHHQPASFGGDDIRQLPCLQLSNMGECLRPSYRRVAGRPFRGHRAGVSESRARTGGKCAPRYSRLDDLAPVIFVTTGGVQARYWAGKTASTPFFFTRTTTNFAGLVLLALRPTVCTSSGPS